LAVTPNVKTVHAQFPRKLLFLLNQPARYKVAYGGRGGMKSYAYADALLIVGTQKATRILCARENMNSIAESVHHLLETRIQALGLRDHYSVEKSRIMGANGTEIIFAGLRHNVSNIKSLEAVDIVWVEEADAVSHDSWQTLIPTIRKDGSEIWITFNPKLATDDTYKRFVLESPPGAIVVKTTYTENIWLPEVLRVEAEYMREHDPAGYRHVWLGECISEIEGAIFAEQLKAMDAEGRLCPLPIDRTKPVDTYWDLGFGDTNAIWFMQPRGGWFDIIDYAEGNGLTVADWCVRLQAKGYLYGTDWLPHDGVDALLHKKLTGDKSKSVEMLLREAGRKVRVAPKLAVTDRINAARTVFSQCRFDSARCADGVQALRHYQWGEPSKQGVARREPLHDWASHPADAFCTLAVAAKHPARVDSAKKPPPRPVSAWA
jgi:phage terminase large subunit